MQLLYILPLTFLLSGLAATKPIVAGDVTTTTTTTTTMTTTKNCMSLDIPITVSSDSYDFGLSPFTSNRDVSKFVFETFIRRLDTTPPPTAPTPVKKTINGTYNIHAEYCTPRKGGEKASTVQVLSHGIGFDHTYWDLPISAANYSYVDFFISRGYSTFAYDRLANGKSSIADPYAVVQSPTELEILHALSMKLRSNSLIKLATTTTMTPPRPHKLIHVGHSYGSILTNALAATYPSDTDGIVLTGYSADQLSPRSGLVTWDAQIAALNQPRRMTMKMEKELSYGYLTWADENANQNFFLSAPDSFEDAVLAYSEANKSPVSVGVLMTLMGVLNLDASTFKAPVQVISGLYDTPFCGGWCEGDLESTRQIFGNSTKMEIVVHPSSGHGINLSFNATGAYQAIGDFLERYGL